MSLYIRRAIIVVPAGIQGAANDRSKQVDTRGGQLTFTVGLSPTGSLPATHYWCSWALKPLEWDSLWEHFGKPVRPFPSTRMFDAFDRGDGSHATPEAVLTQMRLQPVQEPLGL